MHQLHLHLNSTKLKFYNTQILNVPLNIAPNILVNKIKQTTQKHNPPIISNFLDNCGFDLRNTNPAIGSTIAPTIAAIIGIVYIDCIIKKQPNAHPYNKYLLCQIQICLTTINTSLLVFVNNTHQKHVKFQNSKNL